MERENFMISEALLTAGHFVLSINVVKHHHHPVVVGAKCNSPFLPCFFQVSILLLSPLAFSFSSLAAFRSPFSFFFFLSTIPPLFSRCLSTAFSFSFSFSSSPLLFFSELFSFFSAAAATAVAVAVAAASCDEDVGEDHDSEDVDDEDVEELSSSSVFPVWKRK